MAKPSLYVIGDESAFSYPATKALRGKTKSAAAGEKMRAVATSLHHPATAYVSYRELEQDGVKWMGVAKTTDAGKTWKLVWKEDSNVAC